MGHVVGVGENRTELEFAHAELHAFEFPVELSVISDKRQSSSHKPHHGLSIVYSKLTYRAKAQVGKFGSIL